MTAPERLADEHVAWRCAYAGGADPVLSDMAILALEVQASRRLATVHAAAVGIAEYMDTAHRRSYGDAPISDDAFDGWLAKYRAARRAAQPQPDEAERIVRLAVESSMKKDDREPYYLVPKHKVEELTENIRAALGKAGK